MGLFDRVEVDADATIDERVVVLGIDGVPYSLIEDNPETFPNLRELAVTGTGGPIRSVVPPESSACWPALTTGCNPGKTGVYGFQDRTPGSLDTYVPLNEHVGADRLWDRVIDAGGSASVLNVPVTTPPDEGPKRMVSGFLSTNLDRAARPESFRAALAADDYRIDVDARLGHEDIEAFCADARETLDARRQAIDRVIDADDWDLLFAVFMSTDRVNHFLYGDYVDDTDDASRLLSFYERVDRHIGEIRASLPEDASLFVVSDHGFRKLRYEVNCNRWLAEQGWLSVPEGGDSLADLAGDSRAFSLIPGRFYLNLDGREPTGSVPQAAYDETLDDLAAALTAMRGPDGERVIDRVVRGREVYEGPNTALAPDLVALPAAGFDLKASIPPASAVFATGPRNGMHDYHSATFLTDRSDVSLRKDADLLDIAPTVLDVLGLPIEDEIDGCSLVTGDRAVADQ